MGAVARHAQTAYSAPRKVATDHPNASTSGVAGACAVILAWGATTLGLPMDAAVGAAFATLFSTAALVIGRRAPWYRKTENEPALLDPDPDNPP